MLESGSNISLLVAGVDEGDSRADDPDAVDATAAAVVVVVVVVVVVAIVMTCIQELLGCLRIRTEKDDTTRCPGLTRIINLIRSDA